MKAILLILVAIECILLITAISPVFIRSLGAEKAAIAWSKNPTPENKAKFDDWKAKIDRVRFRSHVVAWSLFALNTLAIAVVIQRIRKHPTTGFTLRFARRGQNVK